MSEGQNPTQSQLAPEFQRILEQLEDIANKSVAHRRKFQYACNQFRQFLDLFSKHATDDVLTDDQINAYRYVYNSAREYQQLFSQYSMQCWAHFALEVKSSVVAAELCTLAGKLREVTACIDEEASKAFDPISQQWLQYHILDLRAIGNSFAQHIQQSSKSSSKKQMLSMMQNRLNSISDFLKQYEQEGASQRNREVSPIPVHYQSWRINFSDLTLEKEVGSGVSAIVYFGHDTRTQNEVAIKKLKFKKLSGSKLQSFQRELTILAQAEHPTILHFVGATDTPPFCIVTEWMPNGSLYHDLHKHHRLDATMRTIAMFDIARGMQFLHSRQIIHRDLKSLNILLDKNFFTRICDFGFSRHVTKEDVMTKNVGTPHWMAPELLDSSTSYDNKVDVYAYGIVCWELLTSQLPYHGLQPTQVIAQVMVNNIRPYIPPDTMQSVKNLINECWDRDPRVRPSFNEILTRFRKHEIYFEGADIKKVNKYIDSIELPEIDSQMNEIESQLSTNPNAMTIQAISDLVNSLEVEGAPPEVLERCWESLLQFSRNKTQQYAQGLVPFLGTSYIDKAAAELRNLPSGLLNEASMKKILLAIPSGNETVDTNLVITACKNGFSSDAALHAIHPDNIKLALEMSAQKHVRANKCEQLADRCIQILGEADPMLNVASIRCLVSLNKASLIPIEALKISMQSKNGTLKLAAHIAAAQMALEGKELPLDLIDALSNKWSTEPLASTVLIAASTQLETARHLISGFSYGTIPPPEIALKIIKQAAKHSELCEDVQNVILSILEKNIPTDIQKQFQKIMLTLH